jgi:multimeric flavodoxin WrbA
MHILVIIGTPTKAAGYTMRTVQALERSLVEQAGARLEYIFLEDLKLPGCQGHLTCIKLGEAHCPFSADISSLTNKMAAADGVIFASPVHCFNVSALMKNMIDLFVYQMHRPAFFGKKALVVTTAAGAGQKGVLKYMQKTVANWGFDVVGKLGTHAGLFDEAKYQARLAETANRLAAKFIDEIKRNKIPQPGVAELINFRVWRSVVKQSKDASPFDWEHWRKSGWLDQDYYFPVRVNPLANGMAYLIEKLIERTIRNVAVKPVT